MRPSLRYIWPWRDQQVKSATSRILSGDELTITGDIAYINRYRLDQQEVPMHYARDLISTNLVECHSVNWETGDRHYNFNER